MAEPSNPSTVSRKPDIGPKRQHLRMRPSGRQHHLDVVRVMSYVGHDMPEDRHPKHRARPVDHRASRVFNSSYDSHSKGRMLDADLMDFFDDQDGTIAVARGMWRPSDDGND